MILTLWFVTGVLVCTLYVFDLMVDGHIVHYDSTEPGSFYFPAFTGLLLHRSSITINIAGRVTTLSWDMWCVTCSFGSKEYDTLTLGTARSFYCGASLSFERWHIWFSSALRCRIIDSAHLALLIHAIYFYSVSSFNNPIALITANWYFFDKLCPCSQFWPRYVLSRSLVVRWLWIYRDSNLTVEAQSSMPTGVSIRALQVLHVP